jgi:large subunit ribosomal protein L24
MEKCKLRKNDQVRIVTGKEKGKQGKILRIDRAADRVYIDGLNMVKKAMRKTKQNQKGGIAEIEAPIHLSNVMILCKKCGPTRIGFAEKGKTKARICRKCGEQL